MNKAKSIYCRIFQTCFKIAIPVLPYRKPETISSIDKLPEVLNKENCSKVLLVTDKGIVKVGLHVPVVDALSQKGYQVYIYDKTNVNPTVDNVEEAAKLYQIAQDINKVTNEMDPQEIVDKINALFS